MCNLIICSPGAVCSLFEVIADYRHIFENFTFSPDETSESMVLLHTQNICRLIAKSPIVVYPKGFVQCGDCGCEVFATVLNSSFNNEAENIGQVITCGLCDDDVVTFSSYSQECAVVSLQRSIKTISGRIVEPQDFPIELQSEKNTKSKFDILALSALLILSDRCDMIETLLF